MTADDLLVQMRQAGIFLWADGDRIRYDAPSGALTPEFRDLIAQRRTELLMVLRPPRGFVTLKNGPTMPVEPIELAIRLEGQGFKLGVDDSGQFTIEPTGVSGQLSTDDRASIARWRHHLCVIVHYVAPVCA